MSDQMVWHLLFSSILFKNGSYYIIPLAVLMRKI